MKLIKLTQGQYTLVDDADYDWLNQWKWHAVNFRGHFYVARRSRVGEFLYKKDRIVYMAREILGLKSGEKRQVDHINHDTLNNGRDNLRICTHLQNLQNQSSSQNSTSRFKGVFRSKGRWGTRIAVNSKHIYLGLFSEEKYAAYAYDLAAIKYFKEFAFLNFPDRDYTLPENRIIKRFTRENKTSRYKGVSWFKPTKKWRANICVNGKQKSLGYFDLEEEAALAYDAMAIQVGGSFISYLNF